MRVISGSARGVRLLTQDGLNTRPTADRVKEGVFSALQFDLPGRHVLDLFAGTGNISYEFASRGAESVRAVDRDLGCVKYIGATADLLGFSEVIRVIPCDVFRFLARPQEPCDVVFADPPYDLPPQQYRALVEAVFSCGLLAEEGILVVEHPKGVDLADMEGFTQMRRYGTVHFSFFEHGGE